MSGQRLYGNWLRPQRLSIRGLGWKGALVAAVAYFSGLAVLQSHPRAGLGLLAGCLTLTAVCAVRIGGGSAREYVTGKSRWLLARANGTTRFNALGPRAGTASATRASVRSGRAGSGRWRLPARGNYRG